MGGLYSVITGNTVAFVLLVIIQIFMSEHDNDLSSTHKFIVAVEEHHII